MSGEADESTDASFEVIAVLLRENLALSRQILELLRSSVELAELGKPIGLLPPAG